MGYRFAKNSGITEFLEDPTLSGGALTMVISALLLTQKLNLTQQNRHSS